MKYKANKTGTYFMLEFYNQNQTYADYPSVLSTYPGICIGSSNIAYCHNLPELYKWK